MLTQCLTTPAETPRQGLGPIRLLYTHAAADALGPVTGIDRLLEQPGRTACGYRDVMALVASLQLTPASGGWKG